MGGGGGVRERRGGGQKQGPRDRQGGRPAGLGARGGAGEWWAAPEPEGCAGRRARTRLPGWPAADYKRQGGPRRQTRRGSCQVASSPASSPECCGPWEPLGAASQVRPLPPASPPAGLPAARCPPPATATEPARAPTAPSSCLPPPSPSLPSAQPVPNPSGTV